MNVLVSGGAGFIGSHTVVELINASYNPIILDNFSNSKPSAIKGIEEIVNKKLVVYRGDYQDRKLLKRVHDDQQIDAVIHFAAFKSVNESISNPLKYYQNNVAGFLMFLDFMKVNHIDTLILSSSATVYGDATELPFKESLPFMPSSSPYGTTKQMCESILNDVNNASSGMKSIALRYFNPIGAHRSGKIGELPIGTPSNLVPYLMQAAAGIRDELTVFGDNYPTKDGSCIRDYIHVVDLAKAHVASLQYLDKKQGRYNEAFNIGSGQGSSVFEVIKTFEDATSQKVKYKIGDKRPGDVTTSYSSVDKAAKILGWQSKLSLSDALKDSWRWQKNISKS